MKNGRHLDLRHGDGIGALATLQDVALIFADLPSGATRAPCDSPLSLDHFWHSARRALSRDGTVLLMASHLEYAVEVLQSNSRWYRYELIWRKGRGTGFLNAKRRPLCAHEYVLVFGPGNGTYNPQVTHGHKPMNWARQKAMGDNYNDARAGMVNRAGATDRQPVSVVATKSVANNARVKVHPQQKPLELLRWLIRTYSNEDDLVVDPCAGSGSTGVAAVLEGRRFVGFEKESTYVVAAPSNWQHVIERTQ